MKTLTELIQNIDSTGLAWVEAKFLADQLESDEKPFLSSLMNGLAKNSGLSETAIKRLAMGCTEYRDYVRNMVTARAEANRCRVKYETAQNSFDAARSEMALERSKLEKNIYHEGR